jgi:hypothetical protein
MCIEDVIEKVREHAKSRVDIELSINDPITIKEFT